MQINKVLIEKQLRIKGMQKQELARLVGRHPTQITRLLKGETCNSKMVVRIANILDVQTKDLYLWE